MLWCDSFLVSWAFNAVFLAGILYAVKLLLRYKRGKVDPSNEIDVSGKTVIVTGASAGIGKYTAEELASRGARVIMACRNVAKAEQVVTDIRSRTARGELIIMELNLSSLESVRKFAKEFQSRYDSLDILVNNAGMLNPVGVRKTTEDGFEEQFGVNHLAHFLLTNLLLPNLKKGAPSRIVIVSSVAGHWGKMDWDDNVTGESVTKQDFKSLSKQYCNSKLANNLFNLELSKRLKGTGVNSYALCPGFVDTDIGKDMESRNALVKIFHRLFAFILVKTPREGAATTIHVALSKNVSSHSGEMYRNCEFWDPCRRPKLSEKDAAILWEKSAALVKFEEEKGM